MKPQLSLQLYAVRELLTEAPDETLGALAEMNLSNVEVFDFVSRATALGASLQRHGLHASTGHAQFIEPEQTIAGETFFAAPQDEVFEAAASLGLTTVFDPWVSPEAWRTLDGVRRTADAYNEAAARAATYGLRIGHHNHSQEFARIGEKTALYEFADHLDSRVSLEVDVYWVATAGFDVADVVRTLADRVTALHVKDGNVTPDSSVGAVEWDFVASPQVAAGHGSIDLAAALGAASHAEYAVIEFDHYDGDVLAAIRASAAWLREHDLVV